MNMEEIKEEVVYPSYRKFFKFYKKLPFVTSLIIAIAVVIWSIIDVAVFSHTEYYEPCYGIMRFNNPLWVLLVWWGIGAVASILNWLFSALIISPTVVRTNAVLEIEEHLTKDKK